MIDVGGVKQRIDEFDKRNGGNPVVMGNWWRYANGAAREVEPMGALIEPPTDEFNRLRNVLNYHRARLHHAVRDFDNLKERLMMSACDHGNGIDRLKELQSIVSERSKAVEDAKAKLAATDQGQAMERARQQDADNRQRATDFRERVKEIRI